MAWCRASATDVLLLLLLLLRSSSGPVPVVCRSMRGALVDGRAVMLLLQGLQI